MRAECQHCQAPQPVDWAAGDLCTACGQPVLSELRCFWCADWTPEAKFCRGCGAELVEAQLYGAARMIKDAGTDRFTVPKMLRELDPAQIENFSRIYHAQRGVVLQHVEQVRFLEQFLFLGDYADALEEELVRRLPWPELQRPTDPGSEDHGGTALDRVRAIGAASPFPSTGTLSTLARLQLDDLSAAREVQWIFQGEAGKLKTEAALGLTSWRVHWSVGVPSELRAALVATLRATPLPRATAVRLHALGVAVDLAEVEAALHDPDRGLAFAAALTLGAVEPLRAALEGAELERRAAAQKLVELGEWEATIGPLRSWSPAEQRELLQAALRQPGPFLVWSEVLLELVETTDDSGVRERAARALCRSLRPEWARRIAARAGDDRYIYQSLLSEAAALPPEAVVQVVDQMIEAGHFTMSQYGLREAAHRGALGDDYLPRHFSGAAPETQKELLRLAEVQLGARRDPALERALYQVVFGPHPAEIRANAWWCLHRVYRGDDVRGQGPLELEQSVIVRLFGSLEAFFAGLTGVVEDPASLKAVGLYDHLARLFASTDSASVPAFLEVGTGLHRLIQAVLLALRGDYWPQLLDSMLQFLGHVGVDGRWREEVIEALERLERRGNYHFEKALRTLRLARYDLPDEPEWPRLALDVVPSRFRAATPEAWPVLLGVVDQQLIHRQDPGLRHFLLGVALGPYPAEIRQRALEIVDDRGGIPRLGFNAAQLEPIWGPLALLGPRLNAVLSDPVLLSDRLYGDFLEELLARPEAAAVSALLEDGAEPSALISALANSLAILAERPGATLVTRILGLLQAIGSKPSWTPRVLEALEQVQGGVPVGMAAAIDRVRCALAPPPPEAEAPASAPALATELANPWAAKQAEVERLAAELQRQVMEISFGPASPEEKTRLITELQAAFQAQVKALYAPA